MPSFKCNKERQGNNLKNPGVTFVQKSRNFTIYILINLMYLIADAGFSNLDLFTASEIAQQTFRFLKPVCVHLDTISNFFKVSK